MKYLLLFTFLLISCNSQTSDKTGQSTDKTGQSASINNAETITKYKLEIIDTIPHNINHYTQGLVIHNGILYEGTGKEGASRLIKYNKKYKIDAEIPLNDNIFGEGITIINNKVYQLSWLNQTCFVYDINTLKKEKELTYSGEGWGLTNNDSLLIMSDGSATIRFISPKTFTVVHNMQITRNGTPVRYLNELELVDTLLFANVFMTDWIIIADIKTGKVVGEIDISSLRKYLTNNPTAEVSNGIAYNQKDDIFYLTGKNWNKIFAVKIIIDN